MAASGTRVWDRVVRSTHWGLVAALALSTLGLRWEVWLHQPAGYAAAAIVVARIVWGFVGPGHARFARFVRSPAVVLRYGLALLRGREARHLGHNPLGGWMVLALLGCVLGLAATGWLYTTERFWADETVEWVHRVLAWLLLALVALHVAGVLHASWRHRESLIRAMCDGRKRALQEGDVD